MNTLLTALTAEFDVVKHIEKPDSNDWIKYGDVM